MVKCYLCVASMLSRILNPAAPLEGVYRHGGGRGPERSCSEAVQASLGADRPCQGIIVKPTSTQSQCHWWCRHTTKLYSLYKTLLFVHIGFCAPRKDVPPTSHVATCGKLARNGYLSCGMCIGLTWATIRTARLHTHVAPQSCDAVVQCRT
jgi:hypothetical protein